MFGDKGGALRRGLSLLLLAFILVFGGGLAVPARAEGGGMIRWLQCLREGDTLVTTGLLYAPLLEDEARAGEMK